MCIVNLTWRKYVHFSVKLSLNTKPLLTTTPGHLAVQASSCFYIPLWSPLPHRPPAPAPTLGRHWILLHGNRLGLLILQLCTLHTIRRHLPSFRTDFLFWHNVTSFFIFECCKSHKLKGDFFLCIYYAC